MTVSEGEGIGTGLVEAVKKRARAKAATDCGS